MSADLDLRLAWVAHRSGNLSRRDALLTLAVASAEPNGADWVHPVRDFLVKAHPGHLYDGFYQLDEALADRRVIAALKRLRMSFPETRVRNLVQRSNVTRGPFSARQTHVRVLLEEILAPPKRTPRRPSGRLGTATVESTPLEIPTNEPPGSILAFYLNVLLGVAALCAMVLEDSQDDKRAA